MKINQRREAVLLLVNLHSKLKILRKMTILVLLMKIGMFIEA
jgi:hypothetical protein